MLWPCLCGNGNLQLLDVCQVCGRGRDVVIKDQQRYDDWKRNNSEQAKRVEAEQAIRVGEIESLNSIIISTGDIKETYQVIDTIFTVDNNKEESWFATWAENPMKAFDRVKMNLRHLCYKFGGCCNSLSI